MAIPPDDATKSSPGSAEPAGEQPGPALTDAAAIPSAPTPTLKDILAEHREWLDSGGSKGQRADLSQRPNLAEKELAGADLDQALPPKDFKFESLEVARATAEGAHKVFLFLLLICVFCLITAWTTKDAALLSEAAISKLPFIDSPVPIIYFYWAAPVVLLLGGLYLQVYLLDLWRAMARLPAVFPDGLTVVDKISAWPLVGLFYWLAPRPVRERPPLTWLKEALAGAMGWGLIPLTIFILWSRYLSRGDKIPSLGQAVVLAILALTNVVFFRKGQREIDHATATSRQEMRRRLKYWFKPFYAINFFTLAGLAAMFLVSGDIIKWRPTVDISFADISPRPSNWETLEAQNHKPYLDNITDAVEKKKILDAWLAKRERQLDGIKSPSLGGLILREAWAYRAFLVKADLRRARIERAYLREARLEGAILREACLEGVDLSKAHLEGADLSGANLKRANLKEAHLEGTRLIGARLDPANLDHARIEGSLLKSARMERAFLNRAHFDVADLTEALLDGANLTEARLDGAILRAARLDGAYLAGTSLKGASLTGTRLERAYFRGAVLDRADLNRAHLERAHMRQAIGLTCDQLREVYIDAYTKFPKQILNDCKEIIFEKTQPSIKQEIDLGRW